YTSIVPVDSRTLILMILAAVLGAWLGAGVVAGWPRRRVQIGMGVTLPILAFAMLLSKSQLGSLPGGGTLLGLGGTLLAIAVTTNFALGALMTIGLGLYAPCMILVSLVGMNPTTAFPIMMGSCAFLMPIASARFVRARCFDRRATIGLFAGGIPAVLIAAFIVKQLSLDTVRWLVVVVVLYTAANLLLTAYRERAGAVVAGEPKPEITA
ncbi:MAG TPA: sulfite exporter TauE/SafE family protein, partial [Gemmatimonadaceae bacterium]|nr:sulfite exporter TauE/SafE family protein [Gemmatimonadaceae bacterium]